MTKNSVQVRLSQFITSYGVGSLIDIQDAGSCIVLNFEHSGLFENGKSPNDFLISNYGTSRLSKRLLYQEYGSHVAQRDKHDKIGIFELPSNATYDRNITDMTTIYRIKRFPNWSLCEHESHRYGILHPRFKNCPHCSHKRNVDWNESNRNTVRFVSICPRGHLSDVNWHYHVHKKDDLSCKPGYYFWRAYGTNEIQIICPKCKNSCYLRDIIIYGEKCQRFWPEEVKKGGFKSLSDYRRIKNEKCNQITQIMPRNSSSVFVPEIITAISTPLEANEFYKILNYTPIALLLKEYSDYSPPKLPPDISVIEQKLNEKINEFNINIAQIRKMLNSSPNAAQDSLNEAIEQILVHISKNTRYLKIIQDRAQDNSEKEKVNNLIRDFYQKFLINKEGLSEEDFRREELNVFLGNITSLSYPDVNRTLFVDNDNSNTFTYKNLEFRVVPVPKLEVIMVQQGYKRICYAEKTIRPRMVPTPYIEKIENNDYGNWYPGVRLNGEGVFIEILNLTDLDFKGIGDDWKKISKLLNRYVEELEKDKEQKTKEENDESKEKDKKETSEFSNKSKEDALSEEEKKEKAKEKKSIERLKDITIEVNYFDPAEIERLSRGQQDGGVDYIYKNLYNWLEKFLFFKISGSFTNPLGIWWHTLSHRIIKSLSADCGYTLASIRERIYINIDEDGIKAGLLLYSARPGMDGTMGGLIYQVPRFKKIVGRALENIDVCSNDPICETNELSLGIMNGAACYACLFLPETSCEFGNIGLDRNMLIKTIK